MARNDIKEVNIRLSEVELGAFLAVPARSHGLIIFAHGSGSGRNSPRNQYASVTLQYAGLATLLADLLTEKEDEVYERRFDIELLTERMIGLTAWASRQSALTGLTIGYFGASTGAAAALQAAAKLGKEIKAVVSRGGRPDLATGLSKVTAPTLLIVGGNDPEVLELNRQALAKLRCRKELQIVPGATHLFEESGALEQVADLAAQWFNYELPAKNAL